MNFLFAVTRTGIKYENKIINYTYITRRYYCIIIYAKYKLGDDYIYSDQNGKIRKSEHRYFSKTKERIQKQWTIWIQKKIIRKKLRLRLDDMEDKRRPQKAVVSTEDAKRWLRNTRQLLSLLIKISTVKGVIKQK